MKDIETVPSEQEICQRLHTKPHGGQGEGTVISDPLLQTISHPGGTLEIRLANAPVNALTAPFLMSFAKLIDQLGQDATTRSIVLSSDFKVFSAGLNLKEAIEFDAQAQREIVHGLNHGFLSLFRCPKPTLVAANGSAIAGGLFFLLASDFRVAHENANFGLAEVRVGVDFPVGPMEIARATLTPNDLRRLMLTGQPISATEALRAGIVDELSDDPLGDAIRRAGELADIPPHAYANVKHQIRAGTIAKIEAGSALEPPPWFTEETVPAMKKMLG